ncbi:fatty acyl-CoA reductase 2-like [Symsagittifera roscoffensis]|uniref:fatty acyl-CoA reductase 2-like n=1 Tax=Symsagittifera roscoffensis TaxID=84072 RepID=UPI00307B75FE
MGKSIAELFSFSSILLTGFSGLVGKCLVWKLLKTVPKLQNIYVLVRGSKKEPDAKKRFEQLLNMFPLNELDSNLKNKIVLLEGDMSTNFGKFNGVLSPHSGVDIVIHAASSVNFDESIISSIESNVVGCKNLLDFCKSILKPKLFVYISTAYAHTEQGYKQTETIFPLNEKAEDIIQAFKWMSPEMGEALQPYLLKRSPNSYTYSKAMAENYLQGEIDLRSCPFPVAIVRPTIIGAALNEPQPGFIDNMNAITGAFCAGMYGIWKLNTFDPRINFDCIPVDLCVNGIIATCAYCLDKLLEIESPFIVHLATGTENPCSFGVWPAIQKESAAALPIENSIRYPRVFQVKPCMEPILRLVYQDFYVAFYDLILKLCGSKFRLRRITNKMLHFFKASGYFIRNEWKWEQTSFNKVRNFLRQMDQKDQQQFTLDYSVIKWDEYYFSYFSGVKKYILKESLTDMSKARSRQRFLLFMMYFGEPLVLILFCLTVFYTTKIICETLF